MCSVQCAASSVQYTVYSVQRAVRSPFRSSSWVQSVPSANSCAAGWRLGLGLWLGRKKQACGRWPLRFLESIPLLKSNPFLSHSRVQSENDSLGHNKKKRLFHPTTRVQFCSSPLLKSNPFRSSSRVQSIPSTNSGAACWRLG